MARRIRTGVPFATLTLLLVGCEQEGPIGPAAADPLGQPRAALVASVPEVCGEASSALVAGRSLDVGTVTVANDEEMLYVTFETSGGWSMSRTHVAVGSSPEDLPRQGGQLVPGLFSDQAVHDPSATIVHYAVPLDVLWGGTEAVVAAHADVGNGEMEEGAWGAGLPAAENGGWATYVVYELAECGDDVAVVIGEAGGAVEFGDGGLLTIDPGALGGDVEITVSSVPDEEVPAGVLPGTVFEFGPDGLAFDPPATLVIPYDVGGLTPAQEAALAIHLLEPGGVLTMLPSTVDAIANTVSAEIHHFSIYAIPTPVGTLQMSGPDAAAAGGTVDHVVSFQNVGGSSIPATDLTVELTVEGPVTPASTPAECTLDPPAASPFHYTCTRAHSLPSPGLWHLTFTHDVDAGSAGATIHAFAAYSYDDPGGTTHTGSTAVNVTAVEAALPEADLGVSISPPDGPILVGVPMDWTVSVHNRGPSVIEGANLLVQVRQLVGASLSVDAVVPPPEGEPGSGCTISMVPDPTIPSGADIACTTGFMGVNQRLAWTVTVTVLDSGPVILTATASDEETTDPFADNDSTSEQTFVNPSQ